MTKKRVDRIRIGTFVIHNGKQCEIVDKMQDGNIYIITLSNRDVIRRPPGAMLELA